MERDIWEEEVIGIVINQDVKYTMKDENNLVRRLRSVAAIVLVALYAAGLALMLASKVRLALILWVVSTLGGIGLLYWIHTMNKRREDAEKARSDASEGQE